MTQGGSGKRKKLINGDKVEGIQEMVLFLNGPIAATTLYICKSD